MTNDFRNLFYSRQDAVAQQNLLHQYQQQQQQHQQIQKPLQPLQPSQQMNHQPPVSFYPNNRFNAPMLNANYNLPNMSSSFTSSASAAITNDVMATHNHTMIMKTHNKENLYHGYCGVQLQQQQAHQLSQQQQQQQHTASSHPKFATLTANMCVATGSITANISTMTANTAGMAGQAQAAPQIGSSTAAGVPQSSSAKLHERRQQHCSSLQYLNCNNSGYGLLSEFYEPPKPDTPPSRVSWGYLFFILCFIAVYTILSV